jgi:uncharacterized protein
MNILMPKMTKLTTPRRYARAFSLLTLVLQVLLVSGMVGCAHTPGASTQPPSDTSIHELIETTSFDQIVDRLVRRMGDLITAKTDDAIARKNLNAAQMQIFKEGRKDMVAALDEEMSWQHLEPDVIDCFKEFYTQREVDALIRFYRSPPGAKLLSQVPTAVMVMNQKNVDEWTKIRRTQGDEAYYDRISHDINAAMAPRDIDGIVAFYDSDIGRAINQAADQAEAKLHDSLQAKYFAAMERIKPMAVGLNARIKAAE